MKNSLACSILLVFFLSSFAQEKISPLEYNPQLYHQYKAEQAAKKTNISGNFIFIPNTLTLPFIDDFSQNLLKNLTMPGAVIDTINRSIELGEIVDTFYYSEPAWDYVHNIDSARVDSTMKAPLDILFLNNSTSDCLAFLSTITDTVFLWGDYIRYVLDTNGAFIVSDTVRTDSLIKRYSVFEMVQDLDVRSLWTDDYVFINNTYPVNQLSYGVATFDGLNQHGIPYNLTGGSASRSADTLTSKPIDLSSFSAFSNVYLSFYYEAQGLGDYPNPGDSLVLEFKISCDNWRTVWAKDGLNGPVDSPAFSIVLIHLNDNFYFNNDFQFRFRNRASITGNNDHWHIDYVYMNHTRSITDSVISDMAVLNAPQNFLKNYRSMPWSHFKGFESAETLDSFNVSYRNNYSIPQPLDYVYDVKERLTSSLLFLSPTNLNATFDPDSFLYISNPTIDFIPQPTFTQDSVAITLTSYFDKFTTDLTPLNDTASTDINFFNYFAYDDGSAELAYGLEEPGLKKFACEFNINHDDTLRAIQFHFASINYRLTFEEITLYVWRDINFTTNAEDTLWHRPATKLLYVDEINGFTTYKLDMPVAVQNKFYIGWSQLLGQNIQVGLDLNSDASQHMFIFTNGEWYQSSFEGDPAYPNVALMIRPIVGKDITIIGTGIDNKPISKIDEITFYPNPVSKTLFINVPSPADYQVNIFDLTGRLIYSNPLKDNSVEVEWLNSGIYLLRLSNSKEQKAHSFRFIKLESR